MKRQDSLYPALTTISKEGGVKINHAILHVFDFVSSVNVFAHEELDHTDKTAMRYVSRHTKRALNNLDAKRGIFAPESTFASALRDYFAGNVGFIELSSQIAEYFAGELGHMEEPESCDLLVVDFEADLPQSVAAADEDPFAGEERAVPLESESAHEKASGDDLYEDPFAEDLPEEHTHPVALAGHTKRYFGLFLLEAKQAFMHEVGAGETGQRNDIARHFAILPTPAQKVASYALIDLRTQEVSFTDKKRMIAGEERLLIPDGLLQCSSEASSKETITAVTQLVEAVAQEYGANTAVALSRVKAYAQEAMEEGTSFDLDDMAHEVFEHNEAMLDRFESACAEQELPETMELEPEAVRRVTKNHRIRTDTGIEITFPAEYSRNPEYITFASDANGLISIELKNIAHIENR